MSICLTRFPIGGLGKPNIYHQSVCFTRVGYVVELDFIRFLIHHTFDYCIVMNQIFLIINFIDFQNLAGKNESPCSKRVKQILLTHFEKLIPTV